MARSEKPEHALEHSARVRTLLPLIRKALMIVLSVMVVMSVLSEFGVNIGPLLAGAGIIGLAVGFGSQKLVQDIVTGVFILLEDAVAVGNVVKVAGIGGLVEGLSIRSIRLRDLSGNVHTLPFSSVDTVTNMTKLYSFYLIDIAAIIKARIKTRPIKQWTVGREFNRRMKKRFDELGIEMPFPHRTIYFGTGKDGSAPPLHMVLEQK
jgi:small conductance mechanosensitive channel